MPPDSNSASIPVVCALIERDGRVLLARRPLHKHLGGQWEFPGGKVEPGESPAAALHREIREELGGKITALRALPPTAHDYQTVRIKLIPFICTLAADSPPLVVHEHDALAWVLPDELRTHALAPADLPVVDSYLKTKPPSAPSA